MLDPQGMALILFGHAHPGANERCSAIQINFNVNDTAVVLAYLVTRDASVW